MNIKFTKMHGLGNDFAVIDATEHPFKMTKAQIQQMANRRLGVGFDQLLVIEPALQTNVDFNFRIFNADGNEVGQCGNGARCVAHYIKHFGLSDKQDLCVSTLTDVLQLHIDNSNRVSVVMGIPRFAPAEIPFIAQQEENFYDVQVAGQTVSLSVVNIGNPHAVIKVEKITSDYLMSIGEQLNQHPQFPQGVNVGFMQVIDPQNICLKVYERGAGATMACGSGACAAMVVGRRNGWLNERVTVNQPGGALIIDWQGPGAAIKMTGPARLVFLGEWCD